MVKRILIRGVIVTLIAFLAVTLIYAQICYLRAKNFSDSLPRLDVITENGEKIRSKEEYVSCMVTLSGCDDEYAFSDASAGIRGRGNDTWKYYPKKPYRIKFDEKTSVFGETKNKSWVLLAMYNDFSLIKDRLAFTLSDSLDNSSFSPSYNYVELYINGKYNGIYLLTDQVDENKGRTNVKEDFSEDAIEVPFLVELDARAPDEGEEGADWFYVGERAYAIKYPEADERYTEEQFEYIKGYVEAVDALTKKKNVTLSELSEYIDVQSFIDFYLVQEIMGQTEINWKSIYMSKAVGGVLVMGPVWDFDWSVTGPSTGRYSDIYKGKYDGFRSDGNWFMNLYTGSAEFRSAVAERFNEIEPTLSAALLGGREKKEMLSAAAKRDKLRWHWYRLTMNFDESFDEVIEWCRGRMAWLSSELNS